jgi:putative effector of murein hydrolase
LLTGFVIPQALYASTFHSCSSPRAFQESEVAGAFSGLAMGLSALMLPPPLLAALGVGA